MPTLTATPFPNAVPPRVDLTLTGADGPTVYIVRVDPDGRERPVRGTEPADMTGGTWSGSDFETWFGAPVTYRAVTTTGRVHASGISVVGGPPVQAADRNPFTVITAGTPVTLEVNQVWLRHPGDPNLSVVADLYEDGGPVRSITRAVLQPMRRATPVVVTDPVRRAPTASYGCRTWSLEERSRLLALLADGSPVLLGVPHGWRWGISYAWWSVGDLTETRLWEEWAPFEGRVFTLAIDTVDRPVGGLRAAPCYLDVQDPYTAYSSWLATYPTYEDLRTAPVQTSPNDSLVGGD